MARVEKIQTGDPKSADTGMGTLITVGEAERVERSIQAAVGAGARLLTGGQRDGAVMSPAVVAGVDPASPFSQDELFGPAVAVSVADDWQSAIAQANGTAYGLGRRGVHLRRRGCGAGDPGDRRRRRSTSTGPRCGGRT